MPTYFVTYFSITTILLISIKGNELKEFQVGYGSQTAKTIVWTFLEHVAMFKSDNLQYYMLGCWVDCLIDQASDGPSIILID